MKPIDAHFRLVFPLILEKVRKSCILSVWQYREANSSLAAEVSNRRSQKHAHNQRLRCMRDGKEGFKAFFCFANGQEME